MKTQNGMETALFRRGLDRTKASLKDNYHIIVVMDLKKEEFFLRQKKGIIIVSQLWIIITLGS